MLATGLGWRTYDHQVNEQSQLLEYGIAEFDRQLYWKKVAKIVRAKALFRFGSL